MARILLILMVVASNSIHVQGGFTQGAPCSERNTAFLNPSRPIFPLEAVKCVDITDMRKTLILNETWPIQNADTLYADHMGLTKINRTLFAFMPRLELVDFSGNKIKRMPLAIDRIIPKLVKFLLAKNNLRVPKMRPLMKSLTLSTLMLSHNKIKTLYTITFAKVPAVRVLFLDSNYLKFVTPKMFSHLTNLKYLHLGNNLLQTVPPTAFMPKSLKVYIVKGNLFEHKTSTAELLARRYYPSPIF